MLVNSVNINEFRGVRKCNAPLPLSKFTVLVGRNNSGKSSILEALSLFPDYNNSKLYLGNMSTLNFLAQRHGGYSSLIYGYSGKAELTYTADANVVTFNVKDTAQTSIKVKDASGSISEEQFFKKMASMIDSKASQEEFQQVLTNATFFIPNDTTFMDKLQTELSNDGSWNKVVKSGANYKITNLVNKCVDDKYTEVLRTPALSARKERGPEKEPAYIKIKDLGDGIQKVVSTALWLETFNPSLVLWDDFEGSAHPSLIKELVDWTAKKPWQVVMSTHSFDVISSILDIRPEDTRIIQLKKTNEDILIQKSLSIEELEDIVDSSQDPRKIVDFLEL